MYDASTTFSEGVSCDFWKKNKNALAKEILGRQETECPFRSPAAHKSCCGAHHHETPIASQSLFLLSHLLLFSLEKVLSIEFGSEWAEGERGGLFQDTNKARIGIFRRLRAPRSSFPLLLEAQMTSKRLFLV